MNVERPKETIEKQPEMQGQGKVEQKTGQLKEGKSEAKETELGQKTVTLFGLHFVEDDLKLKDWTCLLKITNDSRASFSI